MHLCLPCKAFLILYSLIMYGSSEFLGRQIFLIAFGGIKIAHRNNNY